MYTPISPLYPPHYVGSIVRTDTRWHYTTGQRFLTIVVDGVIQPSTAFVEPPERPIVWFSTHPVWEATACKGLFVPGDGPRIATFAEMVRLGGGVVRFGVAPPTAPYHFQALVQRSGMSVAMAHGLRHRGQAQGADPSDWWGTFQPVPRELWTDVEVWEEDHWVPVLA